MKEILIRFTMIAALVIGFSACEKEAEDVREQIENGIGHPADITVIPGGQPVYSFVISGE